MNDDWDNDETDVDNFPYSHRHKIKMNRLFREKVGGSFLPFPEVDTPFQRFRSRLVILYDRIKNFLKNP